MDPDNKNKKKLNYVPACGLTNIENNCYLNSIIQCLAAVPSFISFFLKESHLSTLKKNKDENESSKLKNASEYFLLVFSKMIRDMYLNSMKILNSPNSFAAEKFWERKNKMDFTPDKIMSEARKTICLDIRSSLNALKKVIFEKNTGDLSEVLEGHPADAGEVLQFILDILHTVMKTKVEITISKDGDGRHNNNHEKERTTETSYDIKERKNKCFRFFKTRFENEYSPLIEMFCGITEEVHRNMRTGFPIKFLYNNFFVHLLHLPNGDCEDNCRLSLSIEECFTFNTKSEIRTLEGEKQVEHSSKLFLLPDVLVFQFLRFVPVIRNGTVNFQKNNVAINFGNVIDVASICSCVSEYPSTLYEVNAVIHHVSQESTKYDFINNHSSGHYFSTVSTNTDENKSSHASNGKKMWTLINDHQVIQLNEHRKNDEKCCFPSETFHQSAYILFCSKKKN